MTNLELITGALRKLNVINEIETPSAEQGAKCLEALNDMLEQWEEDGIKLQYFRQSTTSDTFPCQAYTQVGVRAALAIRVASDFGAMVSTELAAEFDMGFSTILRKAMTHELDAVSMRHLPGNYRTFNIITGR
jgi:hypothetical protein